MKQKLVILAILAGLSLVCFMFVGVNFEIFEFTMKFRAPQAFAMILTAFCLGVGTVIFQTIAHNRLLTPSILGLTPLYVAIQAIIIFALGANSVLVENKTLNFLLNLAVFVFVAIVIYKTLFEKNQGNILYVLLIGTLLGQFFMGISNFIQRMIDPNEFLTLQRRLFASFKNINTDILVIATISVVLLTLLFARDFKFLNVISLGSDKAKSLGVEYDKIVKRMLLYVTMLTGIATALVGPITFLGFIAANIAAEVFKTYRHGYLCAAAFLIGVVCLAFGQAAIMHIFKLNTTLSVVIDVAGGFYFLWIVLKNRKQTT